MEHDKPRAREEARSGAAARDSDKDLGVVKRDRKGWVLRGTVKLRASQITKQEQLIAQQNKKIEILRQLLTKVRQSGQLSATTVVCPTS